MRSLAMVRNAVLVVAHPDDESLWAGGLLARTPHIEWTVICCTIPKRDPIRASLFPAACRTLGAAHCRVINRTETPASVPLPDDHLAQLGDLSGYDLIVTHGEEGEYGHVHHRQLSAYVREIYPDAATIAYGMEGGYEIALTVQEWDRKLSALMCYDHVLPHNGRDLPKWRALLERYSGEFDLRVERYVGLSD